mgnify:CR=1 FL=1
MDYLDSYSDAHEYRDGSVWLGISGAHKDFYPTATNSQVVSNAATSSNLDAGYSIADYAPPSIEHNEIACSDDFEALEILAPGSHQTVKIEE